MFSWRWPKSAFIAGEPILDFLNTVDFSGLTCDSNRLTSYAAVVAWSQAAGVVADHEARELLPIALNKPFESELILADLVLWREAVYRAFSAILQMEQASAEDWGAIEQSIQSAIFSASLEQTTPGTAHWVVASIDLTTIPKRLALHLNELLNSGLIAKLKKCNGCTWLFIDSSKNHRRQWCAMSTCGSRAKGQRSSKKNALTAV